MSGLSHAAAAVTNSMLDIGRMIGPLLGGFLNDAAARVAPKHGRVAVAQFSVGVGVPIFWMLFTVISPSAAGAILLLAGILITWCQGVNNTIMAEVVPQEARAPIYGLDRMLA